MVTLDKVLQAAKNSDPKARKTKWGLMSDVDNIMFIPDHDGGMHALFPCWLDDAIHTRLERVLKKMGWEVEFQDTATSCSDCGEYIQTEPDWMGWTPRYWVGDGEILCEHCLDEEKVLRECEDRDCGRVDPPHIDPEDHGYTLLAKNEYAADPGKTVKQYRKDGAEGVLWKWVSSYSYNFYARKPPPPPEPLPVPPPDNPLRITEEDYHYHCEDDDGYCPTCRDFTRGECEPDAEHYPCPECENRHVMGTETAMMCGYLVIDDGD